MFFERPDAQNLVLKPCIVRAYMCVCRSVYCTDPLSTYPVPCDQFVFPDRLGDDRPC